MAYLALALAWIALLAWHAHRHHLQTRVVKLTDKTVEQMTATIQGLHNHIQALEVEVNKAKGASARAQLSAASSRKGVR